MANNLVKIRGKHNITQIKLAEEIGVTKQAICFNEVNKCSVSMAKRVAKCLGENVFEILGTDVLELLPETEEDKVALLDVISKIAVSKGGE